MHNPTGGKIRVDSAGSGHFGSPRGNRLHNGTDYLLPNGPGDPVFAPLSGYINRVVQVYPKDSRWKGVEIMNDNFICHLYYMKLYPEFLKKKVFAGQTIGISQDISQKHESSLPHVHLQFYINPDLLVG